MSPQPKIDLTPAQCLIVKTVLLQFLPPKSTVFVFGSRAKGTAKPHSDLDLAIDADGQTLDLAILGQLNEAFDESLLSYKVDIIDLNIIDEEFKKAINSDCLRFELNQ
jgi:type I restriction enzyme S subunit